MTRIGYPLAVRVVSLGPLGVVDAMLVVNVLAFGAIALAGLLIAQSAGRRPVAGLALLFVPAFLYGTTMSVTDTLAGAFMLLGIAMFLRSRWTESAALLSLAALTRETALLFPAVVIAGLLVERLRQPAAPHQRHYMLVGASPFAAAAIWQLIVVSKWGSIGPLSSGSKNITIPPLGPFVTDGYLHPISTEDWMDILVPGATLTVIALALVAIARGETARMDYRLAISLVAATILAISVGPALLETYRSSIRGIGDATIFAAITALFGRGRLSTLALLSLCLIGGGLMLWELRIAPDLS
jgi:hypothetical protein